MAGPITYINTHRSVDKQTAEWVVEIYDANSVPLGEFQMDNKSVRFKYQGLTREFKPKIYPLSVEFGFQVRHPHHESILTFIRTSPESRFVCKIYRDSVNVMIGRFNSDNIVYQDAARPYTCKMVVSDGLNALRNKSYETVGGFQNQPTLNEMLILALQSMEIHSEYLTGIPFLSVYQPYYVDGMALTDNALEGLRIRDALGWRKSVGELPIWSDIINYMCVAFNSRLIYIDGRFVFQNLTQLSRPQGVPITYWDYDKDGVLLGQQSESNDKVVNQDNTANPTIAMMQGGSWRYLAPISKAIVEHKYIQDKFAEGFTWGTGDDAEKILGALTFTSEEQKIRIHGSIFAETTILNGALTLAQLKNHRYILKMSVKIGTTPDGMRARYSTTSQDPFNNPVRFPVEPLFDTPYVGATSHIGWWSYDIVYFLDDIGGDIQVSNNGLALNDIVTSISVGTAISQDTHIIAMQVTLEKVIIATGENIVNDPDYDFVWEFRGLEMYMYEDGNDGNADGQPVAVGLKYALTSPDVGNYTESKSVTYIGDAPNNRGGLQSSVDAGATWQDTQAWLNRGILPLLFEKPLLQWVVFDVLALRRKSKLIYQGGLVDRDFTLSARYAYQDVILIPILGTLRTSMDTFQGELLEASEYDVDDVADDGPVILQDPNDIQQTPNPLQDPPLTPTDNPAPLVANEGTTALDVITSMDIVNNTGASIGSGEWVIITNNQGESELLQLTSAIVPSSTVMNFVSHTFTFTFQIGDPINLAPVTDFEVVRERLVGVGGELFVTVTGPLAEPTILTAGHEVEWYEVWRSGGGSYLFYDAANNKFDHHGVDAPANKITFPTPLPLNNGEVVIVKYKRPKI